MSPFPGDLRRSTWQWAVRLAGLCYAGALFVLTHMPIPPQAAAAAANWDKLFHCGAYFGLAVLAAASTLRVAARDVPVVPLLLGLMVYAGLDEVLQGVVGRTPDVGDWLADVVGSVCGLLFSLTAARLFSGAVLSNLLPDVTRGSKESEIVRN